MAHVVRLARWAAVVLLSMILIGILPGGPAAGSGPAPLAVAGLHGMIAHCSGPKVPSNYSGTLTVQGGGTPSPTVVNITVEVSYDYLLNYTPKGGNSTFSCLTAEAQAITDSSGGFHLALTVPANSCGAGSCSTYLGPWGPIVPTLPGQAPLGYFFLANVTGDTIAASFVAALSSVGLTPWGRTTVSVSAPTVLRAIPLAGNGERSPATVGFDWHLQGIDWTVLNGSGTPNLTVEALASGSSAEITLWVNGSYRGSNESVGPVSVEIAALSTSIGSGEFAPSVADVGTPVTFSVNGSGSLGYNYSAEFDPGLGLGMVTVPCSTRLIGGGAVEATCSTHVSYTDSGTAQPSVELTNGYSAARWQYPDLPVAPALGVAIAPDPLVTYAGAPESLQVTVRAGTGSAPFSQACLWMGTGASACDAGGTGSWTFPVSYAATGEYTVRASVVDASGLNRTAVGVVEASARPTLDPLLAPSNTANVGAILPVSGLVHGGAGPLAYWWNDSLPDGTLSSGMTSVAGELSLAYVATTPGDHLLTLSVRDQLGTVVASAIRLVVLPGPAATIADGGLANSTPTAGAPFPVSWTALDPFHHRLPGYSETLTIARATGSGSTGPAWVNVSGRSFPLGPGDGSAVLGSGLWTNGYLNFTVATVRSGELSLDVASPVPVDAAPAGVLRWWVAADDREAHLSHPTILAPDPRWNHTAWQIADPFGNPIPAGYVEVQTVFGATVSTVDSPILFNGSVAIVWVNYSAPNDGAGTVYVFSEYGAALLPTVSVPAAPVSVWPIVAIAMIGAATVAVAYLLRRRTRRRSMWASLPSENPNGDLQRLAEGRAHLLARASRTEPRSPTELAEGFEPPTPSAAELVDWIQGLVTDGSLTPVLRAGGEPRYLRSDREVASAPPQVELDPDLLDRALEQAGREVDPVEGDGPMDP